jgi:CxxC motif-containing protein
MEKQLICIECPIGCNLTVDYEGCKVTKVSGNNCPKAEQYAMAEIENPSRILTSSVLCDGLDLKMLPVRTDKPIPKNKMLDAMQEIKRIRVSNQVSTGAVIKENFLGLGVNLVACRDGACGL